MRNSPMIMARVLNLDEMQIAVKLRDLHFGEMKFETEPSRLVELFEKTGETCVRLWMNTISPQLKARINMVQPGVSNEQRIAADIIDPVHAEKILKAISTEVGQDLQRIAA